MRRVKVDGPLASPKETQGDRIRRLAEEIRARRPTPEELDELRNSDDADTKCAAVVARAQITIERVTSPEWIAELQELKRLAQSLQTSLEWLLANTRNEVKVGGYWVGDKAEERRVRDDLRSGAAQLRTAHEHAKRGLDALDSGDLALAETYLDEGKNLLLDAVGRKLPPAEWKALKTGAKARGTPATTDKRDMAFAQAFAEHKKRGLGDKAARHAAIKSNSFLSKTFATAGRGGREISDRGLREALKNGQSLLAERNLGTR